MITLSTHQFARLVIIGELHRYLKTSPAPSLSNSNHSCHSDYTTSTRTNSISRITWRMRMYWASIMIWTRACTSSITAITLLCRITKAFSNLMPSNRPLTRLRATLSNLLIKLKLFRKLVILTRRWMPVSSTLKAPLRISSTSMLLRTLQKKSRKMCSISQERHLPQLSTVQALWQTAVL